MRADRLLSIIWMLRAHGQLSTAQLAERLEVSRRTIMRDVDALSAAGVPVYCERGPHGGVRLLPGYRTDVTALNNEESRALFAGVTTWGADSLGLGEALASGLRKLLAAVPDSHRPDSSDVSARIVIDPQGWLPQTEREQTGEIFHTVQEAVFARLRLRLRYRHKTKASSRDAVVDPEGLISAGRSWYLCCSCEGELLFIKVSRIDSAEILPEPCTGGAHIDVAAEWKKQRERFLERFDPVQATAWVREIRWSDIHEWVIRVTEPRPGRDTRSQTGPATGGAPGEEWSLLGLEFVDHLHAMTVLLRLGPDAIVTSPAELRADFTAYLRATLDRYGT